MSTSIDSSTAGYAGFKAHEYVAHSTKVNCVVIGGKSGAVLATGGDDKRCNVWKIGRASPIWSLTGNSTPIESVSFDCAEEMLVSGSAGGAVKLYDLHAGKMTRHFRGHMSNVTALHCATFDAAFLATGAMDCCVKLWNTDTKECAAAFKGHTAEITDVKFSPDGFLLASSARDGEIKLWDMRAGKLMHTFQACNGPVHALCFNPQEFLLAAATSDRMVKLYDVEDLQFFCATSPEASAACIKTLAFNPEGTLLYGASQNGLRCWTWDNDTAVVRLKRTGDVAWDTPRAMHYNAEGQVVTASCESNFVSIWAVDIDDDIPQKHVGRSDANSAKQSQTHQRNNSKSTRNSSHSDASTQQRHARRTSSTSNSGSNHAINSSPATAANTINATNTGQISQAPGQSTGSDNSVSNIGNSNFHNSVRQQYHQEQLRGASMATVLAYSDVNDRPSVASMQKHDGISSSNHHEAQAKQYDQERRPDSGLGDDTQPLKAESKYMPLPMSLVETAHTALRASPVTTPWQQQQQQHHDHDDITAAATAAAVLSNGHAVQSLTTSHMNDSSVAESKTETANSARVADAKTAAADHADSGSSGDVYYDAPLTARRNRNRQAEPPPAEPRRVDRLHSPISPQQTNIVTTAADHDSSTEAAVTVQAPCSPISSPSTHERDGDSHREHKRGSVDSPPITIHYKPPSVTTVTATVVKTDVQTGSPPPYQQNQNSVHKQQQQSSNNSNAAVAGSDMSNSRGANTAAVAAAATRPRTATRKWDQPIAPSDDAIIAKTLLGRSALATALTARLQHAAQLRPKWGTGACSQTFGYLQQMMLRGGGTIEAETEQWTVTCNFLSAVSLELAGVTLESALLLFPLLQAIAERDTERTRVQICLTCAQSLVRMFAAAVKDGRSGQSLGVDMAGEARAQRSVAAHAHFVRLYRTLDRVQKEFYSDRAVQTQAAECANLLEAYLSGRPVS